MFTASTANGQQDNQANLVPQQSAGALQQFDLHEDAPAATASASATATVSATAATMPLQAS